MAPANSVLLLLLVVVASTVLQATQANTDLLRGTLRDTLPRRNLLQVCPDELPGTGKGPVAAQNVSAGDQKCFISVIQAQWQAAVQLVPNLSAKLSRMQFHDAATGAQDASLALSEEETKFGPNRSVRGIKALTLFKDRIFKDCGRTISLPGPGFDAVTQLSKFKDIFGPKYSAGDVLRLMVTLEGAHSLGSASCGFAR